MHTGMALKAGADSRGKGVRIALLHWFPPHRVIALWLFWWARLVVCIRQPKVIGITGTVGKTTTKDMLAAVITQTSAQEIVGATAATIDNMNGALGTPLTILRYDKPLSEHLLSRLFTLCHVPVRAIGMLFARDYPKILILEYGASRPGDIQRLVRLARPAISIVTTIGPGHLEHLKSVSGVFREKSAIVRGASPSGLVVLGQVSEFQSELEALSKAPVMCVSGRGMTLSLNIVKAVSAHLGIPDAVIQDGLQHFKQPKGRLNVLRMSGMTLIDDSHNANPMSMKLALDTLTTCAVANQRRVAILGSMAELGAEQIDYHREIRTYLTERADITVGVGALAREYAPDYWFADSAECARAMPEIVRSSDCVLIKGSHSVHLHKVVDALRTFEGLQRGGA